MAHAQMSVMTTSLPQVVGDIEDTQMTCIDLKNTLKLRSKDASTNNEVTALQEFLLDIGLLDTDPTGYFGAATLKAVKNFQKQSGLLNSGLVGAYTRQAIKEKSCNQTATTYKKGSEAVACTMEYRACADGSAMPRDANCKWREDKCSSSEATKIQDQNETRGDYVGYLNGQVFIKTASITKEYAYENCKKNSINNPQKAIKCTWNGEVIYTTSDTTLEKSISSEALDRLITTFTAYKNGEQFIKTTSTSKDDAYTKCKYLQATYPSTAIKCTWNNEAIYATSSAVVDTQVKPYLGDLQIYKNGEHLIKSSSISKDDAYSKCKYVQTSYPTTAIKCSWNDVIIYTTSNEVLEKNMEPVKEFGLIYLENPSIPEGGSVLGASTMCVNLTRNFHRGDESEDTRLLQTFLNANEFMDSEISGFYGDKTVEAVKRYQRNRGLPESGMMYDFTRDAVRKDSCE